AGEFGFRPLYEARFRALGLTDAVRFLGHVDAMENFFRAMDVVILTSRAQSIEASPNALLEAMSTGRPVVATAVGGVPELVCGGVEGYLVGEWDDAGLASHLLALLRFPELRERLGRAGRARVVSQHGISTVVGAFAGDLRRVVAASTRVR